MGRARNHSSASSETSFAAVLGQQRGSANDDRRLQLARNGDVRPALARLSQLTASDNAVSNTEVQSLLLALATGAARDEQQRQRVADRLDEQLGGALLSQSLRDALQQPADADELVRMAGTAKAYLRGEWRQQPLTEQHVQDASEFVHESQLLNSIVPVLVNTDATKSFWRDIKQFLGDETFFQVAEELIDDGERVLGEQTVNRCATWSNLVMKDEQWHTLLKDTFTEVQDEENPDSNWVRFNIARGICEYVHQYAARNNDDSLDF